VSKYPGFEADVDTIAAGEIGSGSANTIPPTASRTSRAGSESIVARHVERDGVASTWDSLSVRAASGARPALPVVKDGRLRWPTSVSISGSTEAATSPASSEAWVL